MTKEHYYLKFDDNGNIQARLQVLFYQDPDTNYQVAYLPALEIYGYDKTNKKARKSLEIQLEEFFAYTTQQRKLTQELQRLGWKIRSKSRLKVNPPSVADLLKKRESYGSILGRKHEADDFVYA